MNTNDQERVSASARPWKKAVKWAGEERRNAKQLRFAIFASQARKFAKIRYFDSKLIRNL
jgi:hypothetical protein